MGHPYINYGRNPAHFINSLAIYIIFLLWERKWIILTKIKAGSLPLRLLHISTDSNVVSKVIEVTLELWENNAREWSAATQPTQTIVNRAEHRILKRLVYTSSMQWCGWRNAPPLLLISVRIHFFFTTFMPFFHQQFSMRLLLTLWYYNLAYFLTQTTFCAATVAAARMPILLRIHEIQ